MSGILEEFVSAAEGAASPYLIWAKLAGAAILVLGLVGAGWWLHGKFDGTAISKVQAQLAQCQSSAEQARANVNQAAAAGIQNSVNLASQADADVIAQLGKIDIQSQNILENVHAQPDGHSLGGNPSLAAYLDGLRAARAAKAGD